MPIRGGGTGCRLGVVAIVAGLLVAGCSGGDDDPPAPWPTLSAPSVTRSLPPTPPAEPAAANEGTPEGAKAYVRWFLTAYVYARAHSDPFQMEGLAATRDCVFCESIVDTVRKQKTNGQRLVGQRFTVTDVSVVDPPRPSKDRTVVKAIFDEAGGRLVDAQGKVVDVFDGGPDTQLLIALRWDLVTGWHVIAGRFDGSPR